MFYKHWKKLALALTGYFWAGCDDSASSAVCLYGPDPNYSSATENPVSSSSVDQAPVSSSEALDESSSSATKQSSSSNDFEKAMPLYGVFYEKIECHANLADSRAVLRENDDGTTILKCDDSVTCQEKEETSYVSEYECLEENCPEYGVIAISEKKYACDDGNVYNEAEFRARYNIPKPASSSSDSPEEKSSDSRFDEPIAVYGPPCYFDGSCKGDKDEQ